MIKFGDIIDGRRVTSVFELGGGLAYQSEPVEGSKPTLERPKKVNEIPLFQKIGKKTEPEPVEEKEPEKPKRGRRKKEV